MIVIRRRLFWKIYLTLLASLVIVAMLMGWLLWLTGSSMSERWGAFRIHLTDLLKPAREGPPGALAQAADRLGDAVGADISIYGPDGQLILSRGEPVMLPSEDDERHGRWQN